MWKSDWSGFMSFKRINQKNWMKFTERSTWIHYKFKLANNQNWYTEMVLLALKYWDFLVSRDIQAEFGKILIRILLLLIKLLTIKLDQMPMEDFNPELLIS